MEIAQNIKSIKDNLHEGVKLVAVSKTMPAEFILEAYNAGHKIFGENKVQELVEKYAELPKDIEWHFIGHLQSNKVKYLVPFVHLIHGIDSFKILKTVEKEAKKAGRVVKCLLQFHIAEEETKFGFSLDEVIDFLGSESFKHFSNIEICGLMGMATYTDDNARVSGEFSLLKKYFDLLKSSYFRDEPGFCEISMGMSGDYILAINEGSTIVRIGSNIFGSRNYSK